jgi:DNA adenine methylase
MRQRLATSEIGVTLTAMGTVSTTTDALRTILRGTALDATRGPTPAAAGQAHDVLPFLKWAGGKRWLSQFAKGLRVLRVEKYIEPFLGSGAMFFGLQAKAAILSDTNQELIDTYSAIRSNWADVVRILRKHDRNHTPEYYYTVRSQRPRTPATKAARFIYLNRTCWNGLYRVNKRGEFNTPIGSKTRALLSSDAFDLVAARLVNAELVCSDFETQIDRASAGDLIFADPPYTVRHQYNGFVKYNETLFEWNDQVRLCRALERAVDRGALVVCTNADHASIRELYGSKFELHPVERFSAIAGSGGARGNYAELLIAG